MRTRLGLAGSFALAVVTGCPDAGPSGSSSGSSTGTDDGAPTTTASDGPPAATTSTDDGTTAAPPGDTTASTGPSPEGSTDTGTTSGATTQATDDTTTGEPAQPCASGCVVEFACGTEWASEADCVTWCEANLEKAAAFSPFCRAAWEGVSTCVGTLTCEEYEQWHTPMMFPYPCSDADVQLSVECKGQ